MAIVVTIGRNVGSGLDSRPMDTAGWECFRLEVKGTLEEILGNAYFWGTGKGWSEDWGLEDAYTIVLPDAFGHEEQNKVHAAMKRLGRHYGQEAVAVTIGHTSFV